MQGGNANGAWDLSRVQAAAAQSNLNNVISLGYDGIVLDIEECSQTVSVADWNALFAAIKAANLLVSERAGICFVDTHMALSNRTSHYITPTTVHRDDIALLTLRLLKRAGAREQYAAELHY